MIRKLLKLFLQKGFWKVKRTGTRELFEVYPYKEICLIAHKEDFRVIKEVFYDRRYSAYFPFKRKGAVILDIGSHNGYFSVFAEMNTGPESRVVAFEPIIENYSLSIRNFEINQCKRVECYNTGIWGSSGCVDMFISKRNSAGDSFFRKKVSLEGVEGVRKVSVISLNEAFKNHGIDRCDFLKTDCEGSEYHIFYNTSDETFDKIRTVSMEFHDVEGDNNTGLELLRYLVAKGFNVARFNYNETHLNLNFGEMCLTKEKIITAI